MLQRRRLSPVFHGSDQIIDSINTTAKKGIDSGGNFCQTRANVCSTGRGQQTHLTQAAPAHLSLILRRRPLATCPEFRRCGRQSQVLHKAPPCQRHREIILLGQFPARAHRTSPEPPAFQNGDPGNSVLPTRDRVRRGPKYHQYAWRSRQDLLYTEQKHGSNDDTSNLRPTLGSDSTVFAKYLCKDQ